MSDIVQEALVPLATFAATLKPQQVGTRMVQARGASGRRGAPTAVPIYSAGQPGQIWLKLLQVKHGMERHTIAEWHALIEHYGQTPAHPADPRFVSGS